MAEECVITTFEAPEDTSRSRSGSTSGSSDSDVSPICKISPLVVPVSTSPRPLTPKKRHRAEMEQELRRQEEALRAEEAKSTVEEATTPVVDLKIEVETKPEKELPVKKRNSELKEQIISQTKNESKDEKPAVKAKESKTKSTSNVEAENTSTPKKLKPDGPKPAKTSTTPKKSPAAKSPKTATKSPKQAAKSTGGDGDDGEVTVPEGWRRVATQRMQGVSAGKVDVYYWSPTGKKFRSRPQIMGYLEEIGSPLSIEDFNFRKKGATASPARFKSPPAEKKKKVTPKAKAKESPKKTKTKTKPKGRPRKNSGGKSPAKKSPAKKLVKQQRKVMKPPPDTGSKKASRAQQLQKLLVKINFQKPGDIREMSSDESSDVSEDDFDPGTTEEIDNTSEISVTPSPPPSKKMRRHSSPID